MSDKETLDKLECIEDWKASDESLLHKLSTENYIKNGISSFDHKDGSSSGSGVIPYVITSCYPAALEIAMFIKKRHGDLEKTLKILEVGSGSGIFARHFLFAAKDIGILDQIKIIISDISRNSLNGMKERNIHAEFEEGKHFEYLELDMTSIDTAKLLDGSRYNIDQLDYIIMNYAIDTLPILMLNKEDNVLKIKESKVFINKEKVQNLQSVKSFQNDLDVKIRYQEIDDKYLENKLGDKAEVFTKYLNNIGNGNFGLPVLLLNTIENLMKIVNDNGLTIIRDISDIGAKVDIETEKSKSLFFRDTVASYISIKELNRIINYTDSIQAKSFTSPNHKFLSQLLISKAGYDKLDDDIKNLFEEVNKGNFNKMRLLEQFLSGIENGDYKDLKDAYSLALENYEEVNKHSFRIYKYRAKLAQFNDDLVEEYKQTRKSFQYDFLRALGDSPLKDKLNLPPGCEL